tara:strand:+ start:1431 stop:1682 length:252 start_codon:yes stop_codon:yes gene_type:complete
MVRFNKHELNVLMGALESYWGSYENWEQESDEDTRREWKKYHDEAVIISQKISWELEQRDMRKMAKDLQKKAKELQEKQKNNN